MQHPSCNGFTLIELSIVLVIIGLIVGGVLVGRDLIYAAQWRRTMSDIEQFKTAITTFRGKYNCIPGDCPNAYDFFSANCGFNGAAGVNAAIDTSCTNMNNCNGNGNGVVEWSDSECGESVKMWQYLSLAGLVPGRFPVFANQF